MIGTNKKDAQDTVDALLADLAAGVRLAPADPDREGIERLLRARVGELVTYEGWSEIDRHEQALGAREGRPRVKLTRIERLLEIAAGESPPPSRSTRSGCAEPSRRPAPTSLDPPRAGDATPAPPTTHSDRPSGRLTDRAPLAHRVELRTLIRRGGFESRTAHLAPPPRPFGARDPRRRVVFRTTHLDLSPRPPGRRIPGGESGIRHGALPGGWGGLRSPPCSGYNSGHARDFAACHRKGPVL